MKLSQALGAHCKEGDLVEVDRGIRDRCQVRVAIGEEINIERQFCLTLVGVV